MELIMQQGEDRQIDIALFEGANPLVVGPATAGLVSNIQCNVFIGAAKVAQHSLNAQAGFGTIDLHPSIPHVIQLKIERSSSKTFPIGLLSVATLVTFLDANFPNGRNVEAHNALGRITKGDTTDLLP